MLEEVYGKAGFEQNEIPSFFDSTVTACETENGSMKNSLDTILYLCLLEPGTNSEWIWGTVS